MSLRMSSTILLGLVLALCTPAAARAGQDAPLFSFALIADVQYEDADGGGTRYYRESLRKLEACVNDLNGRELAFTVHLGDLINGGFENFDAPLERLNRLRAPHYSVLGNHDFYCKADPRSLILEKLGLSKGYYEFSRGEWRFIVLDGNDVGLLANARTPEKYMEESEAVDPARFAEAWAMLKPLMAAKAPNAQPFNGGIGCTQLAWLEWRLEKARNAGENVAIFCHYPIFPVDGHNLWNDTKLLAVIERFDCVKAWIAGHNHHGAYAVSDGVHYLTVPAMVETADTTAYAVVEVYADRLEVIGTGRAQSKTLAIRE